MDIEYRRANNGDLSAIVAFVDYWLTGGGKADGIPKATHDFFVPVGRHEKYLVKYSVMLATFAGEIIGWAVKTHKGVLIHLLIAATFRGKGIGGEMLRRMNPSVVRSKMDQKSGNPADFYRKFGYEKESSEPTGRKKNIEIFRRVGDLEANGGRKVINGGEKAKDVVKGEGRTAVIRQRSIDKIAKKLGLGDFSRR